MCVCVCARVCVLVHECACVCSYVYACVCVCVFVIVLMFKVPLIAVDISLISHLQKYTHTDVKGGLSHYKRETLTFHCCIK